MYVEILWTLCHATLGRCDSWYLILKKKTKAIAFCCWLSTVIIGMLYITIHTESNNSRSFTFAKEPVRTVQSYHKWGVTLTGNISPFQFILNSMPYNLNMENIVQHNETRDMLPSISSTMLWEIRWTGKLQKCPNYPHLTIVNSDKMHGIVVH